MGYYLEALEKYAVFSGRARRSEFWFFNLFNCIGCFVIGFIAGFVSGYFRVGEKTAELAPLLFILATLLPSVAVSIRRLHDTGKSGWWFLLSLVPFGGLILFVFFVQDSQPGSNQYGPNPKEAGQLIAPTA
jgi:uncharacterized membrane protein YhaH (DUF805 family)